MLKVFPFTKRISLLFSGDTEKAVINLLEGNLQKFLDENNYDSKLDPSLFLKFLELLASLENPKSKLTKSEILDSIIKRMGKHAEWPRALRTFAVLHKLVHDQGEEMISVLCPEKSQKLLDYKQSKLLPKKNDQDVLLPHYYGYLQKLAHNYHDLNVCFTDEGETLDVLQKNSSSLLQFLSKIQNTLTYLLKIFPMLEPFLVELKGALLLKQVTYFCLTDAAHFYTYLNTIIDLMLDDIFHLPREEALFLYEIYSDHIQITKKLKGFFDLRSHLTDFYINQPEYYQLDTNLNTRIELYIAELRKAPAAPHIQRKEKSFTVVQLDIEAQMGRINSNRMRKEEGNTKSLADIGPKGLYKSSKSLNLNDKKLYSPPKLFMRKKGLYTPPKIKVNKPKEKAPTNNILLHVGNDANKNLLKVPAIIDDLGSTLGPCHVPPVRDVHSLTIPVSQNGFLMPPPNQTCSRSLNVTPPESLGTSFTGTVSVGNLS